MGPHPQTTACLTLCRTGKLTAGFGALELRDVFTDAFSSTDALQLRLLDITSNLLNQFRQNIARAKFMKCRYAAV